MLCIQSVSTDFHLFSLRIYSVVLRGDDCSTLSTALIRVADIFFVRRAVQKVARVHGGLTGFSLTDLTAALDQKHGSLLLGAKGHYSDPSRNCTFHRPLLLFHSSHTCFSSYHSLLFRLRHFLPDHIQYITLYAHGSCLASASKAQANRMDSCKIQIAALRSGSNTRFQQRSARRAART